MDTITFSFIKKKISSHLNFITNKNIFKDLIQLITPQELSYYLWVISVPFWVPIYPFLLIYVNIPLIKIQPFNLKLRDLCWKKISNRIWIGLTTEKVKYKH